MRNSIVLGFTWMTSVAWGHGGHGIDIAHLHGEGLAVVILVAGVGFLSWLVKRK